MQSECVMTQLKELEQLKLLSSATVDKSITKNAWKQCRMLPVTKKTC